MLKVKYGPGAFCAHAVSFQLVVRELENADVKRPNGNPRGQQTESVWNHERT